MDVSRQLSFDFHPSAPVDVRRLERSLVLHGERVRHGQYLITGGREAHWVDLYHARLPKCDCADHLWREALCKHILAALLREGDERVLGAVGELVQQLRSVPRAA